MSHAWRLALLTALVLCGHVWLGDAVLQAQWGNGEAEPLRARIDVAFVRELQPAEPVAPVTAATRRQPRSGSSAAAPAASAPTSAAAASVPLPAEAGSGSPERVATAATAASAAGDDRPPEAVDATPLAPGASASAAPEALLALATPTPVETVAGAAAAAAAAAAASASSASASASAASAGSVASAASVASALPSSAPAGPPASEWPPSTRLSYRLTGHYRGPVEGAARVEWLRSGMRYQVFMEASIGPPFAPLLTRRDSSEGTVTTEGLHPQRYDLESKALVGSARQSTIHLDEDRVRLPNGIEAPRPAGVQDAVSQFVHLTWIFTTRPHLLAAGTVIEVPLALLRRVETLLYDVLGTETLETPAGPVAAVHVRPRRALRPTADYSAELWVAPSLQYLPVRIFIRQNAETWIDLRIERLPEQAAARR